MPHARLRPIDQLSTEWAVLSRTPQSRVALRALAEAEEDVDRLGVGDLGALVGALHGADNPAARTRAARLLGAMVRSQGVHPLIARAILQALVPGLVTVARRLAWGNGGEWDDGGAFFADLVSTAWEVIVSWSGQDRDYAVLDLLSAIRCRQRRMILRQRSARETEVPGLPAEAVPAGRTTPGTTDLELLARAIDDLTGHGLERGDAAVLYGHRVLGLSLAEIARLSGRSRRQLDGRRARAEQLLSA